MKPRPISMLALALASLLAAAGGCGGRRPALPPPTGGSGGMAGTADAGTGGTASPPDAGVGASDARAFHDKSVLPWTAALERAYPVIKEELTALRHAVEFQNYTQPQARIHDGGWKTVYLYLGDLRFEHNVTRCPEP